MNDETRPTLPDVMVRWKRTAFLDYKGGGWEHHETAVGHEFHRVVGKNGRKKGYYTLFFFNDDPTEYSNVQEFLIAYWRRHPVAYKAACTAQSIPPIDLDPPTDRGA